MGKWNELRDAFLTSLRDGEECQYFYRLRFLMSTVKRHYTDAEGMPIVRSSISSSSSSPSSSKSSKSHNRYFETTKTSEDESFSVQRRQHIKGGTSAVDDSHNAPNDDSSVSDDGSSVSDDDSSVSAVAGYWSVTDGGGIVVERRKSSRRKDHCGRSGDIGGRGHTDSQSSSSPQVLNEDDRFFAFVASSVKEFSDNEKLEFRVAVLRLMQDFKCGQTMALDHCLHRCHFTCSPRNRPICHSPPPTPTGHCIACVRSSPCLHTPPHRAPYSSGPCTTRSPSMGLSVITRNKNQHRNY